MKVIKTITTLLILSFFMVLGCQGNSNKKQKTEKVPSNDAEISIENAPAPEWQTISIDDDQGHGPDYGTEEAAEALVHRFVGNDEGYQEDGYGLSVTELKKVSTNPEIFEATYMHRHFGDDGMFYTGKVEIKGNKARWVANSDKIIGIEELLENILREALENDNGNTQQEIKPNSKIDDILNTEHQFMAAYGSIQKIFRLDMQKMTSLWDRLSSKETFSEWVDILKTQK